MKKRVIMIVVCLFVTYLAWLLMSSIEPAAGAGVLVGVAIGAALHAAIERWSASPRDVERIAMPVAIAAPPFVGSVLGRVIGLAAAEFLIGSGLGVAIGVIFTKMLWNGLPGSRDEPPA